MPRHKDEHHFVHTRKGNQMKRILIKCIDTEYIIPESAIQAIEGCDSGDCLVHLAPNTISTDGPIEGINYSSICSQLSEFDTLAFPHITGAKVQVSCEDLVEVAAANSDIIGADALPISVHPISEPLPYKVLAGLASVPGDLIDLIEKQAIESNPDNPGGAKIRLSDLSPLITSLISVNSEAGYEYLPKTEVRKLNALAEISYTTLETLTQITDQPTKKIKKEVLTELADDIASTISEWEPITVLTERPSKNES